MYLKFCLIKCSILAAIIISNAVTQNIYATYCKRNLIVFYLMRDASICKVLDNVKVFTENMGLGIIESYLTNII